MSSLACLLISSGIILRKNCDILTISLSEEINADASKRKWTIAGKRPLLLWEWHFIPIQSVVLALFGDKDWYHLQQLIQVLHIKIPQQQCIREWWRIRSLTTNTAKMKDRHKMWSLSHAGSRQTFLISGQDLGCLLCCDQ